MKNKQDITAEEVKETTQKLLDEFTTFFTTDVMKNSSLTRSEQALLRTFIFWQLVYKK
jgi:hypothetical protein